MIGGKPVQLNQKPPCQTQISEVSGLDKLGNVKLKSLKPQRREKDLAPFSSSACFCLQRGGQGPFCLCGIPGIMERTCRKQKSFAPQGLFALLGFIHLK